MSQKLNNQVQYFFLNDHSLAIRDCMDVINVWTYKNSNTKLNAILLKTICQILNLTSYSLIVSSLLFINK